MKAIFLSSAVFLALLSGAAPVSAQPHTAEGLLRTAEQHLNGGRYPDAITAVDQALAHSPRLAVRIRLLQVGAAAALRPPPPPGVSVTARPDSAAAEATARRFLEQLVRVDPYSRIPDDVRWWSGLHRLFARVRSETFYVKAFPDTLYKLVGVGATGQVQVVASRVSNLYLAFAPLNQLEAPFPAADFALGVRAATLRFRAADRDSVLLPQNEYHLIVTAVADTLRRVLRYRVRVTADQLQIDTPPPEIPRDSLRRETADPRRALNFLTAALVGGLTVFAAAEGRANEYDRAAIGVGVAFVAGGVVAAWRDRGATVPDSVEHNRKVRERFERRRREIENQNRQRRTDFVARLFVDPEPVWDDL